MSDPTAFDGVRQLAGNAVDVVLKAGVVVTKGFADTVSGKPQTVVLGEAPLLAIVRHTSSGLSTLARVALDAAREGGQPSPAPQAAPPTGTQSPTRNGPRVAPGETLHIPLSVDNPGSQPMADLVPTVIGMRFGGADVAPPAVRFLPATLTVAPRDFEKLVIAIDVPIDALPGLWQLSFTMGVGTAPIEIVFSVQA
ncbi:hypothetical protein U1763_00050 [Sphingomonas sp. LB2R24]|uniref:hypothetical protein n=1 Tax=Sphingomonas sorbitolis TaxID=3096165 RepID=UPI002FC74960